MMGTGTCNDEDKPDSFELHFLYVEPEFSRNSIGSQMINFFETRGLELGKNELVIWVLVENIIGKSFYEKHNYATDGKSKIFQRLHKKEIRYIKRVST